MVVVDSTILLLLLHQDAGVPTDASGNPITAPKERVEHLVSQLEETGVKIMIPTPVLSEVLVRAGAAASLALMEEFNRQSVFRIEPFDTRAAIELAAMSRAALDRPRRQREATDVTYAKLKFDRQIVAMAKVAQVTTIYTDDENLRTVAEHEGLTVVGLGQLSLPPERIQQELPFAAESAEGDEEA